MEYDRKVVGITVPIWFFWNQYTKKWRASVNIQTTVVKGETVEDAYNALLAVLAKNLEEDEKEYKDIKNS